MYLREQRCKSSPRFLIKRKPFSEIRIVGTAPCGGGISVGDTALLGMEPATADGNYLVDAALRKPAYPRFLKGELFFVRRCRIGQDRCHVDGIPHGAGVHYPEQVGYPVGIELSAVCGGKTDIDPVETVLRLDVFMISRRAAGASPGASAFTAFAPSSAGTEKRGKAHKPDDVLSIFNEHYLNLDSGISVTDFDFMRENDIVKINITFMKDGIETELEAEGNGSLSAVNNALCEFTGEEYTLQVFTQHSMQGDGSHSVAASYIGLERADGKMYWGAGTDTDVITASTKALLSAFCNMTKGGN